MNVIVIGSQGQLASELRHSISVHPMGFEFIFLGKEDLNILDSTGIDRHVAQYAPKFIINCAAYTAVDKAESETEQAYSINEIAVANLAIISKKYNIHLVHISTDFVYDGMKSNPYQESDEVAPLSIYGMSKLAGERAIQASGCRYTIIRTSWLYSSYGANFVKTMMRLGIERDSLNVVYDQIGTPTYARDLADFIVLHIAEFSNHMNEIYHYSNEGVASWYDFAHEIMKQNSLLCQVSPIPTSEYPTPARRPTYSVMDKSKIKSHYSITIPHWTDSLSRCLQELNSTT